MPNPLTRLVLAVLVIAACGKGADKKNEKKDAGGPTAPVAAPIALPATLGVEKIARFNYVYDSGKASYDKAEIAAKKSDWAEVRKLAETSLTKDPNHMDAHRVLAVALAQLGEHAAAVDHLVSIIAADYYNYGVSFASDPLLEGFRATPHGQAVSQLANQIRDEYAAKIAKALLFVARRSAFRYEGTGAQWLSSRGELYAFDRETKRYFRLTHTGHQVAGFVRAKAGGEVAVLGFDKGDRPKDTNAAPLIARGWVQTFDTTDWKSTSKVTLGAARANAVYYGEGDQLLVAQAPAADRWTLGDWVIASVDRTTGKLTKTTGTLGSPRIELTLDEGHIVLPPVNDGVQAVWTGTPARAPELTIGATKIVIPESGQAAQETIAVAAPGGAWLAFATAVDPCAKDAAPSLYVANAKTGALKHLLTAKSRFATRWIDATTLAYEDGESAIRLWDATTGREAMRIENKPGVSLAVLSLASAPLCKQAPPSAEPTGSAGSADEMPPEEGSSGPVTSPR